MTKMTKSEKLEFAALIANAVVSALKENSPNSPSVSGGSRKSANESPSSQNVKSSKKSEKSEKTKKLTIADFEPKGSKTAKGYTHWGSYKAQRTRYCYYVATNGEVLDGDVFGTKWFGKVDFSEKSKYYKAKAEFEKKYHYIKKEDRA